MGLSIQWETNSLSVRHLETPTILEMKTDLKSIITCANARPWRSLYSRQEFHGWDEGGWWRGPISLVDDCRPIFKDILVNAEDTGGERLVPVDEVWYDTSDGEIMD